MCDEEDTKNESLKTKKNFLKKSSKDDDDSNSDFSSLESEVDEIEKLFKIGSKEDNKYSPTNDEFDEKEHNLSRANDSIEIIGKKNLKEKDSEGDPNVNDNKLTGKNVMNKADKDKKDDRAEALKREEKDDKKEVKILPTTSSKKSENAKNQKENDNAIQTKASANHNDEMIKGKSEKVIIKVAISKQECGIKNLQKEKIDFEGSPSDGERDRNKTRSESALELDAESQQTQGKKEILPSEKHSFEMDKTKEEPTDCDDEGTSTAHDPKRISSKTPEKINSTEEKELKQVYDLVNEFSPGKIVLVDDSVIHKIMQLIQDLEKKAKQEENSVGNEYIHLLLNYIDYLSKILHFVISAKSEKKVEDGVQVHSILMLKKFTRTRLNYKLGFASGLRARGYIINFPRP